MKKHKIISLIIMIVFILSSINVVFAASTPRITLDEYERTITTKQAVTIKGSVNIARGQQISLYKGSKIIATTKPNVITGRFSLKIPKASILKGSNTFKVKSEKKKAGFLSSALNASNTIGVTVNYSVKKKVKKSQTITVTNSKIVLNKGQKVNLGAKASSGLKCTYKSSNPKVIKVNKSGKITAKAVGTAKITIKQNGNKSYKKAPAKTVNVTCRLSRDDDMLLQAKVAKNKKGVQYVVVTQLNYEHDRGRTKVYNANSWKVEKSSISTGAKKNQNKGTFTLQGKKNTDYKEKYDQDYPRVYDRNGSTLDKNGKAKYHEYFVVMYKPGRNKPAIHTFLYKPGSTKLYKGSEQKINGSPVGNLSKGCTRVNYDTAEFIYKYCDEGTPYHIYSY